MKYGNTSSLSTYDNYLLGMPISCLNLLCVFSISLSSSSEGRPLLEAVGFNI